MNNLLKKCLLIIAIVLVSSVAITMIGGQFDKEDSSKFSDVSEGQGDRNATKNLIAVEFTLPAEYMGDSTQEELDDLVKELGFVSITLNDDRSANFVMLTSRQRALVDEMRDEIRDSLKELSTEYPIITAAEINSEFNEIIISVDGLEISDDERAIVSELSEDIKLYNYVSGDGIEKVHFKYVNADSSEVIEELDSEDFVK